MSFGGGDDWAGRHSTPRSPPRSAAAFRPTQVPQLGRQRGARRPPSVCADRRGGRPISTTDYPNRAGQRRHSVETMLAGKTLAGPAGMVGPEGVPVPYRVPKVRHCLNCRPLGTTKNGDPEQLLKDHLGKFTEA